MVTLKTKRLTLRELREEDTLAMYYYAKSDKVGPMAGWRPHKNMKETLNTIRLLITDDDIWAITIDDILVGTINLYVVDQEVYDPRIRELGFALNPEYWGMGLISEAVSKVIDYAFNTLKIKLLLVKHYEFNVRSKNVIEKFGFRRTKDTYEKDYLGESQLVFNYEMNRKEYKRSVFYE